MLNLITNSKITTKKQHCIWMLLITNHVNRNTCLRNFNQSVLCCAFVCLQCRRESSPSIVLINYKSFFLLQYWVFLQVKCSRSLIYLIVFFSPQFIIVHKVLFLSVENYNAGMKLLNLQDVSTYWTLKYNISLHKCIFFLIFFKFSLHLICIWCHSG